MPSILNNLPRERLSEAAQNALVSYVERGGSLVMTGGDESFGLGGYQNSPLAKIMPVVMKPPEHKERQRALVLVIDKSGSMNRDDKLKYAVAAAEKILTTLQRQRSHRGDRLRFAAVRGGSAGNRREGAALLQ